MPKVTQDELIRAEYEFPGQIRLDLVTGSRAQLRVRGKLWEFEYAQGRMLLKSHNDRVPRALYNLAFFRAEEAMQACFAGYSKNKKDAVRKTKPVSTQGELFSEQRRP